MIQCWAFFYVIDWKVSEDLDVCAICMKQKSLILKSQIGIEEKLNMGFDIDS